jgi:hypothetical protein
MEVLLQDPNRLYAYLKDLVAVVKSQQIQAQQQAQQQTQQPVIPRLTQEEFNGLTPDQQERYIYLLQQQEQLMQEQSLAQQQLQQAQQAQQSQQPVATQTPTNLWQPPSVVAAPTNNALPPEIQRKAALAKAGLRGQIIYKPGMQPERLVSLNELSQTTEIARPVFPTIPAPNSAEQTISFSQIRPDQRWKVMDELQRQKLIGSNR